MKKTKEMNIELTNSRQSGQLLLCGLNKHRTLMSIVLGVVLIMISLSSDAEDCNGLTVTRDGNPPRCTDDPHEVTDGFSCNNGVPTPSTCDRYTPGPCSQACVPPYGQETKDCIGVSPECTDIVHSHAPALCDPNRCGDFTADPDPTAWNYDLAEQDCESDESGD